MNIIVTKDKLIRLTQYSSQSTYNLTDIDFYISKDLSINSLSLGLTPTDSISTYTFDMAEMASVANYNVYKVAYTQNISLTERAYNLVLMIDGDEELDSVLVNLAAIDYKAPIVTRMSLRSMLAITSDESDSYIYPYGLTDQHEPIDINDRDIMMSDNKNTLVAEDNVSQCMTFRLPKLYDGVDLMSKRFFFDYLDSETQEFLSLPIYCVKEYEVSESESLPEVDGGYIVLEIAIPYEVTKKEGSVPFAISAIDLDALSGGDAQGIEGFRQYVWQTKPSTLTIQRNLGKRPATPIIPSDGPTGLELIFESIEELNTEVETLTTDVEEIKNSDIYNLDPDGLDNEIILDSGTAPEGGY